jgi:hypothetical protein
MKEYELHVSVTYTTDGGSKQYDYFLEYVTANNASEAKKIVRDELKARGITALNMDVLEC